MTPVMGREMEEEEEDGAEEMPAPPHRVRSHVRFPSMSPPLSAVSSLTGGKDIYFSDGS